MNASSVSAPVIGQLKFFLNFDWLNLTAWSSLHLIDIIALCRCIVAHSTDPKLCHLADEITTIDTIFCFLEQLNVSCQSQVLFDCKADVPYFQSGERGFSAFLLILSSPKCSKNIHSPVCLWCGAGSLSHPLQSQDKLPRPSWHFPKETLFQTNLSGKHSLLLLWIFSTFEYMR